jgi:hypothetical protein
MTDTLQFRELCTADYDRGYYDLLQGLHAQDVPRKEDFDAFVKTLDSRHKVFVLYDSTTDKVCATMTLLVQTSATHGCQSIAHIDEWTTLSSYKGAGSVLFSNVQEYIRTNVPCYKISTTCNDKMRGYYEKKGFQRRGNHLCLYV